jgi:Polysaccharide lyase
MASTPEPSKSDLCPVNSEKEARMHLRRFFGRSRNDRPSTSDEVDRTPTRYRLLSTLTTAAVLVAVPAAATGDGAPGQDVPSVSIPPSISGTYREGQTLAASTGTWSGPNRSYTFQWARCDGQGSSCGPIASATQQHYAATASDVRSTLRVVVTATNKNGATVATSDATPVISPALSLNSYSTTSTTTATTSTTTSSSTTPTSTATTTTSQTTPSSTYSADRYLYCFGDPLFNGSGWGGDVTSAGWHRQGYAGTLAQRVTYDDSVKVMQSLGCHTIKAEVQPQDPDASGGTANQRAQVIALDSYLTSGQPSFGIKEGQTHWYGFAFTTNSGFVPHYDPVNGNWNAVMSFHNSPINGVWGPLAPIMLEVDTLGPSNGATNWDARASLTRLARPRLGIQLNGGNQNDSNWPNEGDGQITCHRFAGPVFTPGQLYRVQARITWGAHMNGALQVWIDGVKYVDVTGISNLWYSGTTVDNNAYPVFENYRYYDVMLPTNDVYYGGLLTGSSQADVTVP